MSSEVPQLEPQRLHPLSLPFSFLGHLRGFLIPVALVLLLKRESSWEIWAMVFLVPTMLVETWRYMSLRYWIADDELVVKQGVIQRSERHVPLARIQTIDSTQNFLQRLFQVVEVRVETAGSGEAEAHLRVLSLAARDELRRRVFAGRTVAPSEGDLASAEATPPAPEFQPLHRVPASELMLLGLSPGRGLAILAGIVGITTQLQVFSDEDYASLYGWATSHLAGDVLVDVALGVGLVGLVLVLSIGAIFLRLFDFRLERRGSEYRTQCGLFTRHSTTIPAGRIQFVSIQASPILRLFQKRMIKIRTAGARGKGDGAALTRQWLLPVVSAERVPELVRQLVPGCDYAGDEQLEWRPLAPGASRRALRKSFALGLLLTLIPALAYDSWGADVLPFAAPALLFLAPLWAWLGARAYSWTHTDYGLLTREGVLGRKLALVPSARVQTVALQASPFDRRWRMARLDVDTAGSRIGHRALIPYLERPVAEQLAEVLTHNAETSGTDRGPYRRLAPA